VLALPVTVEHTVQVTLAHLVSKINYCLKRTVAEDLKFNRILVLLYLHTTFGAVLEFLKNLWGLGMSENSLAELTGSLKSILGLLKSLKIRALVSISEINVCFLPNPGFTSASGRISFWTHN
jgi:hypothetical protein